MKKFILIIWHKIRSFVERYPVIVAAIVIYLYYLLKSFNLFKHHEAKQSILDYIMDFDSLFFLWLAAAALIQVQKLRKAHKVEEEQRRQIERVFDRQQVHNQLISDITSLLQDNVNNPLAVISVTTQEIRRRFEKDTEIMRWLDRIESAMKRIHNTIRDLKAYESQKMLDSSQEMMKPKQ